MVSLSTFFRDSASFAALSSALSPALQGQAPISIWTPACAAGQETYSMAMLVAEALADQRLPRRITILGSDLNADALQVAERGLYPESALENVSLERRQRFFRRLDGGYEVSQQVRDCCHFRRQDVISGPAPVELDLVSCRNLLIYLDSGLQGRLLERFHRSLNPDGLLFIGPSESLGPIGHSLFRPVDHSHRVYRRRSVVS